MKAIYRVPDNKKIRVIIDSDTACEADDQFAVAHALLTPRFIVRGITAAQFFLPDGNEDTVDRSKAEAEKVARLAGREDVPVFRGAAFPLPDEHTPVENAASDFIIEEALRENDHPLYILCMGALTNLASALIKRPEIADRFICIWIGGGTYPDGGREFNLLNDYHAANVLFGSQAELWQVQFDCYFRMRVSYAELVSKVSPCGALGKYLFEQMDELGNSDRGSWTMGESWSLGDSPAVGLALDFCIGKYVSLPAPIVTEDGIYIGSRPEHMIRVYTDVDSRFILEDMFAKLELFCK